MLFFGIKIKIVLFHFETHAEIMQWSFFGCLFNEIFNNAIFTLLTLQNQKCFGFEIHSYLSTLSLVSYVTRFIST